MTTTSSAAGATSGSRPESAELGTADRQQVRVLGRHARAAPHPDQRPRHRETTVFNQPPGKGTFDKAVDKDPPRGTLDERIEQMASGLFVPGHPGADVIGAQGGASQDGTAA